MKRLSLFVILFFISFSATGNLPVYHRTTVNENGTVFAQIVNTTPVPLSCWIRDEYTFTSFIVGANSATLWYPVYGIFEWYCQ